MTTPTLNPSEIIEGAKELLKERGWTKGIFLNPNNGCMCVDGALQVASRVARIEESEVGGRRYFDLKDQTTDSYREYLKAIDYCDAVADELSPDPNAGDDIVDWEPTTRIEFNDSDYTDFDNVIELLDKAYQRAVSEGK